MSVQFYGYNFGGTGVFHFFTFMHSFQKLLSNFGDLETLYITLPREPTPHFLVNLTWDAVKGCWVSTCLGDPSEQLLGGQLLQYAAQKKWRPFSTNI